MLRKFLAVALLASMLLGFAGSAMAHWTGTITIWEAPRWRDEANDPYHWIKAKIAEFEAMYPGVKINMVETPWAEMGDRLNVALAGRSWPDIAPVDISGAINKSHLEQGVVEPLNAFFTAEELADFFEGALESYTYKGKLYGIPNSMTVHALLLNLDHFEARGVQPPVNGQWTWDEFVETVKALTYDSTGDGKIDTYGFSTYIANGYYEAWPFFYMDGAQPLTNGEFTFDSPQAISAMQKLVDLKFKHKAAPVEMGSSDVGGTFQAFANPARREIAIQPWASWAIATVTNPAGNFYMPNLMVANYPTGSRQEPITIGGTGGWIVFHQRDRKKLEMVVEFVKFLSSTQEQYAFATNYGTFPARQSVLDMEPYADKPHMLAAAEMLQYAVSVPDHLNWNQIDERIQAQLQLIMAGEKTPEQGMRDARSAITRLLR